MEEKSTKTEQKGGDISPIKVIRLDNLPTSMWSKTKNNTQSSELEGGWRKNSEGGSELEGGWQKVLEGGWRKNSGNNNVLNKANYSFF